MLLNRLTTFAVALLMGISIPSMARAAQGPWDVPPQELNDIQRQGFHEGIEAARHDFQMRRPPNVDDHEIYRHPHMPPEQREAFRDGFRRGYDRAMSHLRGGAGPGPGAGFQPGPPPPPPQAQWDAFPNEFNDVQRQGFHDGIEGARRDFENRRPPTPENRDEFRHPHVPPPLRGAYREGFRRGYNRAMSHLMGRPFQY
jgi:hypothetical protein